MTATGLAATISLAQIASALAQDATTPPTTPKPGAAPAASGLEVISVTSNRRAQNIQKVPATVTAITGRTLAQQHVDSAEDVASLAANAVGFSNDGRERPRYYIRGIGNGNVADNAIGAVAIYNDEVYLNSLAVQGFPLFDLARVEVLNGPQGTLWGKNATAGAIQFISNPPSFTPGGYVQVDLGDYGQRRGEGVINGPIVNDTLAARLSVRYENQDGWAKDEYDGKHAGDFGDLAVRGQLLYRIDDTADITFNVHAREVQGTLTPYYYAAAPTANSPLVLTNDRNTDSNVSNHQSLFAGGASARANWRLNGMTLTSITSFDQAVRAQILDGDYTPKEYSRTYGNTRPTQESEEIRLASNGQQRLTWITGAYYFHEYLGDTLATGTLPPGAATTPAILGTPAYARTDFAQNTQSAAAFANATYTILPKLKLTAGLRFTYDTLGLHLYGVQATGTSATYNNVQDWWLQSSVSSPLATIAKYRDSQSWSNVNYEVEPQYALTPNQLLYVRIASGYRSGNFNTQVTANPTARGGPPLQGPAVVNPETLTSYEVGYKSTLLENRLIFDIDAFYGKYNNIQVSYTATDPTTRATVIALANAASGENYGGELSFRALPIPDLSISGNVGLLGTDFTNFTGPVTSANLSGNQFARAPRQTANLGADYHFYTPFGDGSFGTHWNYTGHYYYLISNEIAPALQQNGNFLGDVHGSFHPAGSRWELSAIVNNVADSRYKIQVLPYSGTTHTFEYAYGPPLTFLVSAKLSFF
jgi:iron complex outermembrane receptor protein